MDTIIAHMQMNKFLFKPKILEWILWVCLRTHEKQLVNLVYSLNVIKLREIFFSSLKNEFDETYMELDFNSYSYTFRFTVFA
jgi:hypothetical protein